ncbi:hypothetical protein VTK73DRAFT_10395 [Phialemonium thermophilum]|uniref:Serine hydrolase domain-containing protein n=1 Tax=Phialemonium thermophilum TaxID=223376 RepID=A0ABR3XG31_9PEZI
MRILCLHGQGASASIFQSQTAAFRAKLDETYLFEFVDAPFPCPPAPGINAIFDSGHYAWYPKQAVPFILGAHRWLLEYIEDHGPYDAVCCFSQGCAVVLSLLLYHAKDEHDAQKSASAADIAATGTSDAQPPPPPPLPFRAAIFICGGVPFPALEDLGINIPRRAHEINDRTGKLLREKAGDLARMASHPDQIRRGVGLWDDTDGLLHNPAVLPDPKDVFGLDFTSFPPALRVQIPTVHIYGAKDPRWPSSMQLAYFCDDRKMYDHGGGHDIPRSTKVSNAIADLIRGLDQAIACM